MNACAALGRVAYAVGGGPVWGWQQHTRRGPGWRWEHIQLSGSGFDDTSMVRDPKSPPRKPERCLMRQLDQMCGGGIHGERSHIERIDIYDLRPDPDRDLGRDHLVRDPQPQPSCAYGQAVGRLVRQLDQLRSGWLFVGRIPLLRDPGSGRLPDFGRDLGWDHLVRDPQSQSIRRLYSLTGVSCVSVLSCVAVGTEVSGSEGDQTLVETWGNGSTWSVTPSPNPGSGNDSLNGFSCSSATSCVAVGASGTMVGLPDPGRDLGR